MAFESNRFIIILIINENSQLHKNVSTILAENDGSVIATEVVLSTKYKI